MSLISRKAIRIGRAEREYRDDRVFVVASDDTYAPKQYFDGLSFPRVMVLIIHNGGSAASSPEHVVDRLKQAYGAVRQKTQPDDEFWLLLDTDHNVRGPHLGNLTAAMTKARQAGFSVAMSNPCFDLWLLLHHEDVPAGVSYPNYPAVEARLKAVLGSYNKTDIGSGRFPRGLVEQAIERARALESEPDNPKGDWPATTGTRVYRLMERILGRGAP